MLSMLHFSCVAETLADDVLTLFWLQLKDLQVFTVVRVIFQLAEEIPCISAVVVALLSDVQLPVLFVVLESWEKTTIVRFSFGVKLLILLSIISSQSLGLSIL